MVISNVLRSVIYLSYMVNTDSTITCLNARLVCRRFIDPRWWDAAFNLRSPCSVRCAYLSVLCSVVEFYFQAMKVAN